MAGIGKLPTVIDADVVAVQLLEFVTVTVYAVVVIGETESAATVAPVLQA